MGGNLSAALSSAVRGGRAVQQHIFWQRVHCLLGYKSTPLSSPPSTLHPSPPSRHIRRRMSDMPTAAMDMTDARLYLMMSLFAASMVVFMFPISRSSRISI